MTKNGGKAWHARHFPAVYGTLKMPQSRKLQQHMQQLPSTLSLRARCGVSWLIFACDLLLERLKALLHLLLQ